MDVKHLSPAYAGSLNVVAMQPHADARGYMLPPACAGC